MNLKKSARKSFESHIKEYKEKSKLKEKSLFGLGLLKKRLVQERTVSKRGRQHWAEGAAPSMSQSPQTAVMDSTVIKSFSYRISKERLTIQFQSGHIYEYYDVPKFVVESLGNAPSKGHYFYYNIRKSFKYQRIK
jgi:hypothetical protein